MKKKAALELSVGTIVIIVLAMTMLILGIVLIRNIMCGAINLVAVTESNVKNEIDKLFQSQGGEVACIGEGEKTVTLVPGEFNTIYCAINAPKKANYEISVKSMHGNTLTENDLKEWVSGETYLKVDIAPGDDKPKKFLKLKVPANAPNDLVTIDVEVKKDGTLISSLQLDFEVRKIGFFRSAVC